MLESKDLTNGQLKDYAEVHLQYEYDMLLESSKILGNFRVGAYGNIPHTVHDALLNSFSMHARNLLGFLYDGLRGNALRSNSVSIENYLDKELLNDIRPPFSEELDLVFFKTSKQVAHLTTERIDLEESIEDKVWRFVDILKKIMELFSIIIPHVPEEKMSSSLKTKLCNIEIKTYMIQVSLLLNGDKENNVVGINILEDHAQEVVVK